MFSLIVALFWGFSLFVIWYGGAPAEWFNIVLLYSVLLLMVVQNWLSEKKPK